MQDTEREVSSWLSLISEYVASIPNGKKIIDSSSLLFRQSDTAMYYAKRALEILREDGPVELTKRSLKFIGRAVRPIKRINRKSINRLRYCWYYFQYYGSTPHPNKVISINPAEIEYALTRKYVWSPLDTNIITLEQNRPLSEITKYKENTLS